MRSVLLVGVLFLGLSANARNLYLTCTVKNNPVTGARITVDEHLYNKMEVMEVPATIELFKGGKRVMHATNAMVGERLPITVDKDHLQPLWAMKVSMGRSGSLMMGYDVVNNTWNISVNSMELMIEQKSNNAVCGLIDEGSITN